MTREAMTASANAEPLLVVEDLRVVLHLLRGDLGAVNGVSFTLPRGKVLGIVGESGSGKSVLARSLMGLLPRRISSVAGSIRFEGTELVGMDERSIRRLRGGYIAMVFQDPMRSFDPIMTVGGQIAESLRLHLQLSKKEASERAVDLLAKVRIPLPKERASAYPHQLSGGMRQRSMIAMALAGNPKLLVADEPTTALDVTTQSQIMDLLGDLREEFEMSVLFITHDLNLAARYTDEIAVMYAGRIVEHASSRMVFREPRMPYSKALIDAIPALSSVPHSLLAAVPGRPPDPLELPPGCAFNPRCAYATYECKSERPELAEHEPGHRYACWNPLERVVVK